MNALTKAQLKFIKDLFQNNLPVFLYGGFAEEALLFSTITREHHDVDLVILRKDKDFVREKLKEHGCTVKEISNPNETKSYKYLVKKNEVEADIVFVEWDDQRQQSYAEATNTKNQKVRAYFDQQAFNYPEQKLNQLTVKTVSPLMQMQMRVAFYLIKQGKPRPQDIDKQTALRQKFFPHEDQTSKKFEPEIIILK